MCGIFSILNMIVSFFVNFVNFIFNRTARIIQFVFTQSIYEGYTEVIHNF